MAADNFNQYPAWLKPPSAGGSGAGYVGNFFALAPEVFQTPDSTGFFFNGRTISGPKVTHTTDSKLYVETFILPQVDAGTRAQKDLLIQFVEAVKFDTAPILSADSPQPSTPAAGVVGPYRQMIGLFMTQAQYDAWYASHPGAVHPD